MDRTGRSRELKRGAPRNLQRALPEITAAGLAQGGVIGRAQLLGFGMTSDAIDAWRQRGLLVPVARWVYALPGLQPGPLGRRWAAALSVGNDAAITGEAALDGHGLVKARGGAVDVLIARGNPKPQPGIVVHRTRSLPATDVVEIDGLRYASVARTIFDRAPALTAARLDQVVDRAVHLRTFDRTAFERLFVQWPTHAGVTALRGALGRLDATAGRSRTELERLLVRLIVESHLPAPDVNARVAGFEVDISWFGTAAIIEADGRPFHTSLAQIERDAAKTVALEAAGFRVRRFDWDAVVYRPVETLREAERHRLENLAPPVPTLLLR